jgi:hypothetical protein
MRHERRPDDRYRAALRSTAEPVQPYEADLWRLKNQGVSADPIIRVVDVFEDAFERELLQAWIIAGASDTDIHARLGMSLDMLGPFRHLCCNVNVFRDKLELLRWIRAYDGTREGRLLLDRAVHLDGVEAIAHFCGLPATLDPNHVNEQVMRETYFRSIGTMRNSSIAGADAQAAHQLMKTATVAAVAAQKRGAPNMAETLLKLKHREMTFHLEDIAPSGEILH